MRLKIYNTRGKKVEDFHPLSPPVVKIYTCGPTVYRYAHIGNLRTYLMSDMLVRTLSWLGLKPFHVKNITDVGHMRQEMLERGEDRVIAAARAAGKSPREIADFYTEAFLKDERRMNFVPADVYPRASEHVGEMIELVKKIIEGGYTYERDGTIYFDVEKDPEYGCLSGNVPEELLEGHRIEADAMKKRPEDFTLWKRAEPGREMKWDSPWGEGFPGWHIECVAMAVKYLGKEFDFHTGGIDLVFPHHENELAQARCGLGAPLARYWLHGGHLLVDGKKMAKSTGNEYTLDDLEERGFSPLDFRYLCLTAHYRTVLNFTFESLEGARKARKKLQGLVARLRDEVGFESLPGDLNEEAAREFESAVLNDLNFPKALSVVWKVARSSLSAREKLGLLLRWDEVLGVGMGSEPLMGGVEGGKDTAVDEEARNLAESLALKRQKARRARNYAEADRLREEIRRLGYCVIDEPDGYRLEKL